MTVAALIVSIVAVVVSCLLAWFTWRNTKAAEASADAARQSTAAAQETVRIEAERRAEEVQDRAVAARVEHSARVLTYWGDCDGGRYTIIVENEGPADAREVTVLLEPPVHNQPDDGFTFQRIFSGRYETIRTTMFLNSARDYEVTIEWTDGNGTHTDESQLHW